MLLSCRLCQWLGFRQALEKSASATSFVSPFGRHKVTLLQAQLSTLAVGQRNHSTEITSNTGFVAAAPRAAATVKAT